MTALEYLDWEAQQSIRYEYAEGVNKTPNVLIKSKKINPGNVSKMLWKKLEAKPVSKFKPVNQNAANVLNKVKAVGINTIQTKSADIAQPPKSPGFKLRFDYCIVTIERSWLKPELFDFAKLFYCQSLPEGYFSTGEETVLNKGVLRAIPKAFIVIKNLEIEANWLEEEFKTAREADGLGFFNLKKKQIPGGSKKIISAAIQTICWICEVVKKTPANADPGIKL